MNWIVFVSFILVTAISFFLLLIFDLRYFDAIFIGGITGLLYLFGREMVVRV